MAANVDATDEPELEGKFGSSTTFEFDGVKIGVIGYITEETPDISNTGNLIFNNVVETIKSSADFFVTQK